MTDPLDILLDDLRADVPEMSDRAFEAGRVRVLAVADPIPVTPTPEPEPVVVTLPRRPVLRSPPRRARRLVASAAAAVALNRAADNITATDPPLDPGEYRYVATHSWTSMGASTEGTPVYVVLVENLNETWVPQDDTHEWMSRSGLTGQEKVVLGSPEDAGLVDGGALDTTIHELRAPCGDYTAADEGREPCTRDDLGWETLTPEFVDALPRDPGALLERLRNGGVGTSPLDVVSTAAGALGTGRVPADLRAALYRALALMPELEITEELANLDGGVGMAFGAVGDGVRQDLIVDTATGQFIGERMVAAADGEHGPAGTVISYTAVTSGVADQLGVLPAT